MILSGKSVAEKILAETKERVTASGGVPGLGVVLVGDDPASRVYVGIKESRARELGFHFVKTELPLSATEAEIIDAIRALNEDDRVHGIIVQLPLPLGINTDRIIPAIDAKKDADGFLMNGKNGTSSHGREKRLHSVPVFPEAMIELAKSSGMPLSGKSGVVLVNSERFGKTMSSALRQEGMGAQFFFCHSRGSGNLEERFEDWIPGQARNDNMELSQVLKNADFVFTALGRPETLSRSMFKKDAVVIDGGIAKQDGKIVGDVSVEGSDEGVFLSPVPGGVGPVTVACLLRRVATLALKKSKTA